MTLRGLSDWFVSVFIALTIVIIVGVIVALAFWWRGHV
jgi:hypothetical protein